MSAPLEPAGVSSREAYDSEMLADLEDMFGRERFAKMLAGLDDEIARRLDPAEADIASLGRNAHALVSVSGTLGFLPLSNACADLERCLLDGLDPAEPLSIVRARADEARAAITALRAERA